jgi:ABC-type multidrug transport system ATPase subunit
MKEIVRVAKDERIIIICTIHQPSTKVYAGFDQVMIMSRGRQAFTGDVTDATEYFESIGCMSAVFALPMSFYFFFSKFYSVSSNLFLFF